MRTMSAAILATVFLAALPVSSQEATRDRISWIGSAYLKRYFERNPERKFAVVYAYHREKPHFRFSEAPQAPDLVEKSRTTWYFAYLQVDRGDDLMANFRLTRESPPTLILIDRNLNELARSEKIDILSIRTLMARADREMAVRMAKAADEYKAVKRVIERGDRDAAIAALVKYYISAPRGTPDLDDCVAKLEELAKEDFAKGELAASVGPDAAMEARRISSRAVASARITRASPPTARSTS